MLRKFWFRKFSTLVQSPLTKDRYPNVKRKNFGVVSDKNVQELERVVGTERIFTQVDDVAAYNEDWLKMVCGTSRVVLRPKTVEEVSAIMKICDENNLAVCPQGGNTGLVGGSTPIFDEVVISMSLMNKLIKVNDLTGIVSCEAGCIVEQLNGEIEKHGLMLPHDLGSKGSCQIGGNISTCAGGLRLLRYGNFQGNILGLEAVLADGTILNCMNELQKDNTGYHLREMFIGAEGTLGIVTKAVIRCPQKPQSVNFAFLGLNSFSDVLSTFKLAKRSLSETLSACEMLDSNSMRLATEKLGLKCPIGSYQFYMVVETHGSNENHDQEKMSSFVEKAMKENIVQDGTIANEPSRVKALWQIRERLAESLTAGTTLYQYDISLPVNQRFYDIVNIMKEKMKDTNVLDVTGFSHIGDGNLHLNLTSKCYEQSIVDQIETFLFKWVAQNGGSISAEHGLGFKKNQYIHFAKTPESIQIMKNLKRLFDPKGILNPYKVLPL